MKKKKNFYQNYTRLKKYLHFVDEIDHFNTFQNIIRYMRTKKKLNVLENFYEINKTYYEIQNGTPKQQLS